MNNRIKKRCILAIIAAFLLSLLGVSAKAAPAPVASVDGRLKDAKQFESFAETFMKKYMDKYHVPGVTLSVVKDGKVFLKKGYGYSDVEKKTPVNADSTVFRSGSVSKLFTATAVMQLVEQGKIDLNADVNQYIKDFKIKSEYKRPVTMANLLTHTAGFDEVIIGIQQEGLNSAGTFGEYLQKSMPPVIREPGTVIQYSNHGMALAGYIVEKVSGVSFDKYVEDNIFTPLNMKSSSFKLTGDMLKNFAAGYIYENEKYIPVKPFSINLPPAGQLSTTADDMSRFLLSHLQKGKYDTAKILNTDTALDMQKQHFTNVEGIPGFAYGFYENVRSNIKTIEHAGAITPFTSLALLIPAQNAALFISANSIGGKDLNEEFANEFCRMFKEEGAVYPVFSNTASYEGSPKNFEGTYVPIRQSKTTAMKFLSIFSSPGAVTLGIDSKGQLVIKTDKGDRQLKQVGEFMFHDSGNNTYIGFKKDSYGGMYLTQSGNSIATYEKKYGNSSLPLIFTVLCLITFLIGCIIGFFSFIKRRKKLKGKNPNAGMLILGINCLLNMVFTAGFMLYIADNILFAITPYLILVLCIPLINIALTAILVMLTILAWIKRVWRMPGRIYFTLTTMISVLFMFFLNYLNLIGFKF